MNQLGIVSAKESRQKEVFEACIDCVSRDSKQEHTTWNSVVLCTLYLPKFPQPGEEGLGNLILA